MKVSVAELRKAAEILFNHLEGTGQIAIEIDDDFYWQVPASERYDSYKSPENHTIGQLSDDWDEIQKLVRGNRAPVGFALVWLASILRRVGETCKE